MEERAPLARHPLAVWLNLGARYQYVSDGGFLFRGFLGAATMLNPSEGYCDHGDGEEAQCHHIVLGYVGVSLGYAFSTDFAAE
jgi:hypothetical protein